MKIQPGQQYEVSIQYSQEQVNAFMEVTGDRNPLHHDAEYAGQTIFKRPIIHGFLSASVFSKIFGTSFPGEGTIYLSQSLNFLRPMYVDQPYRAVVEVTELFPEKNQGRFTTHVLDERGKLTIAGEALLMNPLVIG